MDGETEISATCKTPLDVRNKVREALKWQIIDQNISGSLQAVVWGGGFAGVDQSHRGVAVVQSQYNLKSFGFRVIHDMLLFRGRRVKL